MSGLIKNRLTRGLRRAWNNSRLKRRHTGLILGTDVAVVQSKLGRYNMICDRSSISNSTMGDFSYVGVGCRVSNAIIGKFCSFGPNVLISPGMHPSREFVSTHPIFYSTEFKCHKRFATEQGFIEHAPVQIGHDVWIGAGACISDDIVIGTGAIVATGAVVTMNVEPYSIVGGVPAKPIRKRFTEEEIQQLLDSKWWEWDDDRLSKNHTAFHSFESFIRLVSEHKDRASDDPENQ